MELDVRFGPVLAVREALRRYERVLYLDDTIVVSVCFNTSTASQHSITTDANQLRHFQIFVGCHLYTHMIACSICWPYTQTFASILCLSCFNASTLRCLLVCLFAGLLALRVATPCRWAPMHRTSSRWCRASSSGQHSNGSTPSKKTFSTFIRTASTTGETCGKRSAGATAETTVG